jgi:hypothetical protein
LITFNFRLGLEIAVVKTEEQNENTNSWTITDEWVVNGPGVATPSQHITESQRRALASQSPSVRVHSKKHHKASKYHVTENKSTIVGTKPYNK